MDHKDKARSEFKEKANAYLEIHDYLRKLLLDAVPLKKRTGHWGFFPEHEKLRDFRYLLRRNATLRQAIGPGRPRQWTDQTSRLPIPGDELPECDTADLQSRLRVATLVSDIAAKAVYEVDDTLEQQAPNWYNFEDLLIKFIILAQEAEGLKRAWEHILKLHTPTVGSTMHKPNMLVKMTDHAMDVVMILLVPISFLILVVRAITRN